MSQKKNLYLLCGCPASGKSTWVKSQKPGVWCSRDQVRFMMVKEDEEYFSREDEVFNHWIYCINRAIENETGPKNIYVDATHISQKSRNKVLNKLYLDKVNIIAVDFNTPLKECLRRNAKRPGRECVPPDVLRQMYNNYQPPTFNEKYKYMGIIHVGKRGESNG